MWRTRGHEAVELLKTSLGQGRVSHAYLFTGPDRIGKSALARELAMALNCTAWQGEPQTSLFGQLLDSPLGQASESTPEPGPCYECPSCRKVLSGSHPDVQIVEEWTTESSRIIDQVRAIQYGSGLLPYEGRRKVYVLLNAQDLTLPAQNALLKTLEEPAPSVCLILSAATPQALLPTVVSRCQQIQLRPPSTESITATLVELVDVEPQLAEQLANLAAGRMGWAIEAAADPSLLDARRAALDQLSDALGSGTASRFRLAELLSASAPEAIDGTLQLWLAWLRDLLLLAEDCDGRVVNRDQFDALRAAVAQLDARQIQSAVRAVQEARWQVASTVNTRMALEVLMLRLPTIAGQPSVSALDRR